MKWILNIGTSGFQFISTFILCFVMFMAFAVFDYEGGVAKFVGLALIHPSLGVLMAILTIIVCFLAGMPIRFIKRLNIWWRRHFYLALVLVLVGMISCAVSLLPNFIEEVDYVIDGMEMVKTVPNQVLSISGWFIAAFGAFHFYPPLESILEKLKNTSN